MTTPLQSPCDRVDPFIDGAMDDAEAERFRGHLSRCARCQAALEEAIQLRLLAAEPRVLASIAPRGVVLPLASARRRLVWAGTGLAAAAAAVLAVVALSPHHEAELALAFADRTERPFEERFSSPEADRYLPYRGGDAVRGGERARSEPSYDVAIGKLTERKQWLGVATLKLLDGNTAGADTVLEQAPRSSERESDRALVALRRGDPERALALVEEALAASPRQPAALWNKALALRRLELPMLASRTFDLVAQIGEPGWSGEARANAESLRAPVEKRHRQWKEAQAAGVAMAGDPARFDLSLVDKLPDTARLYFYRAVRSARSAEAMRALLPIARKLDEHYGGGVLVAYLNREAASDLRQRPEQAALYQRLVDGTAPDAANRHRVVDQLRHLGARDLLLGALVLVRPDSGDPDAVAAYAKEVADLAASSGDPWQLAIADLERARAARQRGATLEAERELLAAIDRCGAARVHLKCDQLRLELSWLYKDWNRPLEAHASALATYRRAVNAGQWEMEVEALKALSAASRFHRDLHLSRAYADEIGERPAEACETTFVHLQRAQLAVERGEPTEARHELNTVPACGGALPQLAAADIWADVGRYGMRDNEIDVATAIVAAQRARGLSREESVWADKIEGRLQIDRDPAKAKKLLRKAILDGSALPPWQVDARKARSYSYATLIDDAGRHGRWPEVFSLMAEELGLAPPERCAVAMARDFNRELVVVLGADRRIAPRYAGDRSGPITTSVLVDAHQIEQLSSCETVDVFARPPLQGSADLLPPRIAWRYRVGHPRALPASQPGTRLVVSDVTPPSRLGLDQLQPWQPQPAGNLVPLAGKDATPSKVLAAMTDASVIEFHTHGLVDLGFSDVSFLVLTPEADGRYALTAREVKGLARAPLVILAACRAAEPAPYRHEPWSLPMAFINGGARAVLASTKLLRDDEAQPFFDDVRTRIDSGAQPAVALKEARLVRMAQRPDTSVISVLLFE